MFVGANRDTEASPNLNLAAIQPHRLRLTSSAINPRAGCRPA
jgi:hypothetical protein